VCLFGSLSLCFKPFHNPAESYRYYSLPYCSPKEDNQADKHSGVTGTDNLGEVLAGDRRRKALYDIRYGVDIQWYTTCLQSRLCCCMKTALGLWLSTDCSSNLICCIQDASVPVHSVAG
jgi:hypothetical protein